MRSALQEAERVFDRKHETLSGAIEPVKSWGPNLREAPHRHSDDFFLAETSDALGESFLCANRAGGREVEADTTGVASFGAYYGVIFQLRSPTVNEGALALFPVRLHGDHSVPGAERRFAVHQVLIANVGVRENCRTIVFAVRESDLL